MARVQFAPPFPYAPNYTHIHIGRPHVELYPNTGIMALPQLHTLHPRGPSPPDFLFCVEMGMLLRSRHLRHNLARTLKEEISSRLRQAGIPNHTYTAQNRTENYKDWTISEDSSIPYQPADHRYGIKITSPCFRFGPGHTSTWLPLFDIVMAVLNHDFETTTHHACGTTVHLVPTRGNWTLSEAKRLAITALYFERCFDALVPFYRRRTVFAKSIRYNRFFSKRTIPECVDAIQSRQTDSFAALAARMNWCGGDSATGEALGMTKDFPHETFRWNFTGLDGSDHGRGTVEFRQPPGVTDAADAIRWIMLVGCFARLSCAYFVAPEEKPSMAHLGKWIRYEARMCGFASGYVDDLRRMFERADPVQFTAASARDAEVISEDEAVRLRWMEMGRWNVGAQKYREWARYHPRKRRY